MTERQRGSVYELDNYLDGSSQVIYFTSKRHGISGTTNEEVVNMMIERFYALNEEKPSRSNLACIKHLKAVRRELRDRERKKEEYVSRQTREFGAEERKA